MLSNPTTTMDSVNHFQHYIDKAKELNMSALCFSEHGNIYEWLHKKQATEKAGLKYIHGVEAYVTKTLDEKVRDNYHVMLICANYEGFKELNYLMSAKVAFNREDNHFYYQPRISYDELKNTSDNIIITTACAGGILGGYDEELKCDYIRFLSENKHRCYLEIQHHNTDTQIKLNKFLYTISKKHDIPLIAGTDTHSLDDVYADGRVLLQKSKNTHFENEEGWDLTFKSYEELVECYTQQNSLPLDVVLTAINNTNVLNESVEHFCLNFDTKYPRLYDNSEQVLKDKIVEYIKERGTKMTNELKQRIVYELETYKYNGAIDYLLLEEDIKKWCRENGIEYGYSRGSVSGSQIAYLLRITDIDSMKFNTSFERFMNKERVSLADVDTDYPPSQREIVKEYIYNKKGLHCADIVTFNTIADKGAIRDVGRALEIPLDEVDNITKRIESDETKVRSEYPELFRYVDLLKGVVTSVSFHPCGVVVSPFPIEETVSTFTTTTNNNPIAQLNMKELDSLNFVKLDILGLDNIEIINEACELANIQRLTPDNMDCDDERVWMSIRDSSLGIFQWESDMAFAYYRQLFSDQTLEIIKAQNSNFSYIDLFSIGNGAIRPAGSSYRNELAMGMFKDNGHEVLNEFLKPTAGYLVYQEQIIEFLNKFCGFTMGEADIVRRGFAKKSGTEQYVPKIKEGFIQTMREKYDTCENESERIIVSFLQVIEDASSYLFSYNHSLSYSFIGYACAWLRYYYPLEFLTVMLNINKDNLDKTSAIIDYMNKFTNIKLESIKYGKSLSEYTFDKKNNTIYKGIGSIKYCNDIIADELMKLSRNKHNDFLELLVDIKEKTSVNSRQLNILIALNFFEDFGKNKYLIDIVDLYEKFFNVKQINKKKISEFGITEDIIRKHSSKETPALYKEIDNVGLIDEIKSKLENKSLSVVDQIRFEIEYLEYTTYTNPNVSDKFYIIIDFKTYKDKTKPYVTLRNIKTGNELKTKIKQGQIFVEAPFTLYNMLKVEEFKEQYKTENIGGKWMKTDKKEKILYKYTVVA